MGFWTGLVQGTLMCGAALAALSLALPDAGRDRHNAGGESVGAGAPGRDPARGAAPLAAEGGAARDDVAPQPSQASAAPNPRVSAPAPAPGAAAPAPDAGVQTAFAPPGGVTVPVPPTDAARVPAADRLPEPVGSEFRRASDDEPRIPAPLGAPAVAPLNVQAAAPPAPEAHPERQSAPADRPDPGAPPVAPAALARGADSPELAAAPAAETPIPVAPPGRVAVPALDRLPERGRDPGAAQAAIADPADVSPAPDSGLSASLPTDASHAAGRGGPFDSSAADQGGGGTAAGQVALPPDETQGAAGLPPAQQTADLTAAEPRPAPDLRLPAPLAGLAAPLVAVTAPPAVPALPPPADDPTARPDLSDLRP